MPFSPSRVGLLWPLSAGSHYRPGQGTREALVWPLVLYSVYCPLPRIFSLLDLSVPGLVQGGLLCPQPRPHPCSFAATARLGVAR